MTEPFHYSSVFTLDKAYLTECYEQTFVPQSMVQAYKKAMIFILLGLALLYVPNISAYLGSFFIGLGIIEALSVRFAKAWWVTRQLIGKSGNNAVNLSINENGIHIQSSFIDQQFAWQKIKQLTQTEKGLIFSVDEQRQYLSNSTLTDEALRYIQQQVGQHA